MAPSTEAAAPVKPASRLLSLRAKALLLFLAVGLAPAAIATARLLGVNREAVEISERQLQAAVLAEVSATALGVVREAQSDAEAVAAALAFAAASKADEDDALRAVRALLATRRRVAAVRFEVPAAKIDTVIRRESTDGGDGRVPVSTAAARAAADERNAAFFVSGPGEGVVVVPIPPTKAGAPRGYLSARVDLSELGATLTTLATRRLAGDVRLLVADADRRAVFAVNVAGAAPGADVGALPVWKTLPSDASRAAHIGAIGEHDDHGVRSVGAIEQVEEIGWSVAIWRPTAVAYAALEDMRREGLRAALASALLALLAGLVASGAVTRPILRMVAQARLIGQRRWSSVSLKSTARDELGELERALGQMAGDLEKGEEAIAEEGRLRGDLSRFLSRELVDAIVRGEHPMELGGRRAAVSVLFADVVAFTPLAESRPAEQVVTVLNELFSMLSEIVFRHGGTVDKFIGDCIMAVWGAPVPTADHAARALAAAEDMMRFLETANEGWKKRYDLEIRLAVGINSGEAIVGNVGSNKRMEYTVIGDVVNVAARLEAIAAPNQILVGESTHDLAGDAFPLDLLGERRLTGRQNATRVFALPTD